ncbi:MAG: RNA polymerase sigma factor [Acidimicrobiales bacterium]
MTPRPGNGPAVGSGQGQAGIGDPSRPLDIDLTKLYEENEPAVRRRLLKLGRRHDAADLAHDAFVRTIASPPGNQDQEQGQQDSVRYLHTVTSNVLRDRWRREKRAAAGNVRLFADARLMASGADTLAMAGLEGAVVRAAVARLPQEQQDVLRMRVVDGCSSDHVALLLGRTPAAIRQIQHRALATLRKELTEQGWEPDAVATSPPTTRSATTQATRSTEPAGTGPGTAVEKEEERS